MLQGLNDFNLGFLTYPRTVKQRRKRRHVVSTKHGIYPRRLLHHHVSVLLREAATNGDLHARVIALHLTQLPKRAVESLVRVLTHGARVEHDEISFLILLCRRVPRFFKQARQPFGVMHVHLAAESAHLVRAWVALRSFSRGGHGGTVYSRSVKSPNCHHESWLILHRLRFQLCTTLCQGLPRDLKRHTGVESPPCEHPDDTTQLFVPLLPIFRHTFDLPRLLHR